MPIIRQAQENIKNFYEYMENDAKVFKKMGKLELQEDLKPEKFAQKLTKLANKEGFNFSSNDVLRLLEDKGIITEKDGEWSVVDSQETVDNTVDSNTKNTLTEENYSNKKRALSEENKKAVAGGKNELIHGFSKGELAFAKVAKRAILNKATDISNIFYDDFYHGE